MPTTIMTPASRVSPCCSQYAHDGTCQPASLKVVHDELPSKIHHQRGDAQYSAPPDDLRASNTRGTESYEVSSQRNQGHRHGGGQRCNHRVAIVAGQGGAYRSVTDGDAMSGQYGEQAVPNPVPRRRRAPAHTMSPAAGRMRDCRRRTQPAPPRLEEAVLRPCAWGSILLGWNWWPLLGRLVAAACCERIPCDVC